MPFQMRMMRCGRSLATLAASVLMFAAASTFAQLPTGTILGNVRDPSGGTVADATVTVTNADTGSTRTLTTGSDGAYRFPALPVGHYNIKVEHPGFQTEAQNGLLLEVTQEAVVTFTLQVGATTQEVQVTSVAPLVETTTSSLGGLVNEERVADLPLNGRNWADLTLLQPGMTSVSQGSAGVAGNNNRLSSNGAPQYSNSYLLDGAPMMNFQGTFAGAMTGNTLGVDGIKEFKVVTSLFSAEFGMSMGSQTVIVSKGGTNQFHGDAFEYLRNSAVDAANYFDAVDVNDSLGCGTNKSIVYRCKRLPPFRRNQFGGSFGGPIQKQKTFFYAVFEGLRSYQGETNLASVPLAACHGAEGATIVAGSGAGQCPQITTNATVGLNPANHITSPVAPFLALFPNPNLPGTTNNFAYPFTQPIVEDYGQLRVDRNFSDKDSFFARYTVDNAYINNPLAYLITTNPFQGQNQFLTFSENHIFSPTLLNTARISVSRIPEANLTPQQATNIAGTPTAGVPSFIVGQPLGGVTITTGITSYGPALNSPAHVSSNIFTLSDDIFYTHGRNSFKLGFLANYFQDHSQLSSSFKGVATFSNLTTFLQGNPSLLTGTVPGSVQNVFYTFETFGLYLQDDFRATSKLTLNLGLRYEIATTPLDRNNHTGNLNIIDPAYTVPAYNPSTYVYGPSVTNNPSLHNFSPRLGFAWDVFGNGKTAVRGGFAVLYDISNFAEALNFISSGSPPFFTQGFNITGPGSFTAPFTIPSGSVGLGGLRDLNVIQQPTLVEENLSVEQQLPFDTVLSVAYVGTRGFNLWQAVEGNPISSVPTPNFATPKAGFVTNGVCSATGVAAPVADQATGTPCWASTTACQGGVFPTCRVDPNYASVVLPTTHSSSWYNALQVGVIKRVSHGLEFQSEFTWEQTLDTTQGMGGDGGCCGEDPYLPGLNKGPSTFDTPKTWQFNALYHIPNFANADRVTGKFADGWFLTGIVTVHNGQPFNPTLGGNRSFSGVGLSINSGNDRPDVVTAANVAQVRACAPGYGCNPSAVVYDPATVLTGNIKQWYNPNMFVDPAIGYLGDAPRDFLRGPGLSDVNFALNKDTAVKFLGEQGTIEFRAEVFNIFNHPNFGAPTAAAFSGSTTAVTETAAATAGLISATAGGEPGNPRQIQFALKLLF